MSVLMVIFGETAHTSREGVTIIANQIELTEQKRLYRSTSKNLN